MERVKCNHGLYLCPKPSREQCTFVKEVKLPVMQCPQHGALVGLCVWSKKNPNEIQYFCTVRESKMWCGSLDIKEAEKENADPHPLEKSKKMATKADDASESRAVVVTDKSDNSTDQSVSSGDETRSDVEESSYMEDESRDDIVNITSDSMADANESSLILSMGKPERVIDPTVYRSTVIINLDESESGEEEDGASEESHLTHPDTDGSYVEVVDSSYREEEEETGPSSNTVQCTLPPKQLCMGLSGTKVQHAITTYPQLIPHVEAVVRMIENVYSMKVETRGETPQPGDRQAAAVNGVETSLDSLLLHLELTHCKGMFETHGVRDLLQVPGITDEDCLLVILHPMDLSTIRQTLLSGQYDCPSSFLSDIRLVFKNAKTYNRRGSAIYKMTTELQSFFEMQALDFLASFQDGAVVHRTRNTLGRLASSSEAINICRPETPD